MREVTFVLGMKEITYLRALLRYRVRNNPNGTNFFVPEAESFFALFENMLDGQLKAMKEEKCQKCGGSLNDPIHHWGLCAANPEKINGHGND